MTVLKNVGDHPGGTNITFCQHFRKTTWSQNNFCLAPPQICQWAFYPQQNVEFVWFVMITLQWRIHDFPDGFTNGERGVGRQPLVWPFFCRKLHEIERNLTQIGRESLVPPGSTNSLI